EPSGDAHRPGDALHIVEPLAGPLLLAEHVGAVGRGVVAVRGDVSVGAWAQLHSRLQGDSGGQDETAVVVGVLADEVDTPGRGGPKQRRGSQRHISSHGTALLPRLARRSGPLSSWSWSRGHLCGQKKAVPLWIRQAHYERERSS